jgi:hypothetical protein
MLPHLNAGPEAQSASRAPTNLGDSKALLLVISAAVRIFQPDLINLRLPEGLQLAGMPHRRYTDVLLASMHRHAEATTAISRQRLRAHGTMMT